MATSFDLRYVLVAPATAKSTDLDRQWARLTGTDSGNRIVLPARQTFDATTAPNMATASVAVIPWVTGARFAAQPASTLTMTSDGWVEHRNGGFRVRDVVITGTIGPMPYSTKQTSEAMRQGASRSGTPQVSQTQSAQVLPPAFQALLQAIDLFNRRAADPTMVLHLYSLDEGRYYVVVPTAQAQYRDDRSRGVSWHYEFRFKALDPVTPPAFLGAAQGLPSTQTKAWYEQVRDALNTAHAGVGAALSYVKSGVRIATTVMDRLTDQVAAFQSDAQDTLDVIDSLMHEPQTVFHRAEAVKGSWNVLRQTFHDVIQGTTRMYAPGSTAWSSYPPDTSRPLPPAARVPSAAYGVPAIVSTVASVDDAVHGAIVSSRLGIAQERPTLRAYPIGPGDTPESIAYAVAGDASLWPVLMAMNKLRAPYISAARLPGTAGPGDLILIPVSGTGTVNTLPGDAVSDEALFGRGMKLTPDGDWSMAPDTEGTETVAGVDCVAQGVSVRVQTTQGDNPVFPTLGLPEAIGIENVSESSFAVAAFWQLFRDDRIVSLRRFDMTGGGDTLGFDAEAVLVDSRTLPTSSAMTLGG